MLVGGAGGGRLWLSMKEETRLPGERAAPLLSPSFRHCLQASPAGGREEGEAGSWLQHIGLL